MKLWNKQKGMRLLSGCLDLLMIFVFAFVVFILYDVVYLRNNTSYRTAKETEFTILKESHLYEELGGGAMRMIQSDYDVHLEEFYEVYPYDVTSGYISYEEAKEKSGFFVESAGGWVLKENFKEDSDGVRDFFAKEMNLAIRTLAKNGDYQKAAQLVSKKEALGQDISIFSSCTVFLLILPFCLKDRGTLGKKICKLKMVSKHGNPVHFVQVIVRYLVLMIVVVFFSTMIPGAFLLMQAGCILLTKEGKGLDDCLADTLVLTSGQIEERKTENEKENG